MMRTVSVGEFIRRPGSFLQEAVDGEYTSVRFPDGRAAILIDEPEWTILVQALKLCMDHPELVQERSDG